MARAIDLYQIGDDPSSLKQALLDLRRDFDSHNHDNVSSKGFDTIRAETMSARALSIRKRFWTDDTSGFWAGLDGSTQKFYIGNATSYLKWDGSALSIAGTISGSTITGGTLQTASSGQRVVINSSGIEFFNSSGNSIATILATSFTKFINIISPSAAPFDAIYINQKGAGKSGITIVCDDSGAGSEGIFVQNDGDASAVRILSGASSAGKALEFNYLGTATQMIYGFNNSGSNVVAAYFVNNNTSNAANTAEFYKVTSNSAGNAVYAHITGTETGVAGHFEQATAKSTNFFRVLRLTGGATDTYVWVSDGTTPNGNLSGTAGSICLNGPSGQTFYCSGGTTWVGM